MSGEVVWLGETDGQMIRGWGKYTLPTAMGGTEKSVQLNELA